MYFSDNAYFSANGAEFSDDFIQMFTLMGCHKAGAKRFMAGHDTRANECVHINSGIEKFFPEKKGFYLVFDKDGDNGCPRWHKGKSLFKKRLANVIGV